MRIDAPGREHLTQLRRLWQEAFGDSPEFMDIFFRYGYAPERCRCILEGDTVAAALYWFPCADLAYVYGVATDRRFRGRGLCRRLMEDTAAHLKELGFTGIVLVPQDAGLRKMYAAMGYRDCGGIREFACEAGEACGLRAIGPGEFARLRRSYLPEGAVLQEEEENLVFLARQAEFFTGEGFLLTAWREEGVLHGLELLGDETQAAAVTAALDCRKGIFRVPGDTPFAMFLPLTRRESPTYFGFAFD